MDRKGDENSPANLWARRSNSSKLSLSMGKNSHHNDRDDQHTAPLPSAKRYNSLSSKSGNPFNQPLSSASVASPTAVGSGASSAFGLGGGAFSFGASAGGGKTPKTPGSAFDFGSKSSTAAEKKTDSASEKEGSDKDTAQRRPTAKKSLSSARIPTEAAPAGAGRDPSAPWPLKNSWIIHYRPPQTSKNVEYEKSIQPLCRVSTAQEFWSVYSHLRRPSALPAVSDYHIFKEGIRPVWEDDANKAGGKWTMRLKKGVADRYWEDLLLAMIGDQFNEASDEVCGAVVSVRQGEDLFSIWTKNDGGRNVKIRETIKRVLSLPPDTNLIFKSHDESIVQRNETERMRHEKGQDKRRNTLNPEKARHSGGGEDVESSRA